MRIKELDALRGLAALGVFLFHFQLFDYGYLGVHLFFIISGFVIFLTANSVKNSSKFVIGRFSRLYPTFWVCLLITSCVLFFSGQSITTSQIAGNFTMFQAFLGIENIDGAYWSLTEELVFYMIVFVSLALGIIKRVKVWAGFMLLAALAGLMLNTEILLQKNLQDVVKYFGLFVAGIIFYKVHAVQKLSLLSCTGLLVCLGITVQYSFGKHLAYFNPLYETLIIMTFFGLFTLLVLGKLAFLNKFKGLLFFGKISYPFYLLHQEVGLAFRHLFETENILVHIGLVVLIFAGITLLATAINRYIENTASYALKKYLQSREPGKVWNQLLFRKKNTATPIVVAQTNNIDDTTTATKRLMLERIKRS
ncbi:acyltransferase family protein [Pontibacter sp. MBLB2868]|uniref:acyltransferase family protein n=1 Tax=Pontibacter sp. MBLB2868 TaxID=3451555 RepID=UPI003F752B60